MQALTPLFATAAKGTEDLLAVELRALGATEVKETRAGVRFAGGLEVAYYACLWSRIANRVLLPLSEFPAGDADSLYAGVQKIKWLDHLAPAQTLAVDFGGASAAIQHTKFGAQKVKDAIVDQLRSRTGRRPSVNTARPDVRVNVYLYRDEATVSLDLSGESLHKRGYRTEHGAAPLKENLAAAILLRAGWPEIARAGGALVDPMCGSGTLPIEAAFLAADIAPGLLRDYFGFKGWKQHRAAFWSKLIAEANERRAAGLRQVPLVRGYDHDPAAVATARRNLRRAGLEQHVQIERRALSDCVADASAAPGLVVVNPPYGERVGETAALAARYRELGSALKRCYPGWRAAVFTGNPEAARHLGLQAHKTHTLYNGTIVCKLLHYDIHSRIKETEC